MAKGNDAHVVRDDKDTVCLLVRGPLTLNLNSETL